jgi:hypothetical protein
MTSPDMVAIVERAHKALDAMHKCRCEGCALATQVLSHDIAPLISRIRYLEHQLETAQQVRA